MKIVMKDTFLKQMLSMFKELLFNKHKDLLFLPERIKTKLDDPEKLVCNIHNKKNYVVHIRALKQALTHELILKKVHKVIQFNQEARLKPYIEMTTKLRTEVKNYFEKDFFKLIYNSVFGTTMENVRKHRDTNRIKEKRR